MTTLENYRWFAAAHWETGSIRNALAQRGVTAPHSGAPLSEALLLGISGGIVFGYFTFHYEGYDPQVNLLTRNTFDPMQRIFERLGIAQQLQQTSSPQKAQDYLRQSLEEGEAPLVWADFYSLPYNTPPADAGMWAMFPVTVCGYDGEQALLADRAAVALPIPADTLQMARSRVKKDKYRLMTLDAPRLDKLPSAVQKGIWDTILLFTEKPPKGSRNNFGFAAMAHWATMLRKERGRGAWGAAYAPGRALYAALTSAYSFLAHFGKLGLADRALYADFLDEAALILQKPALAEVAAIFRESAAAWAQVAAGPAATGTAAIG